MNTPFIEIYELFQDRIIRDTTFFIKNEAPEDVQAVAEIRMKKLLNQAIFNILVVADKKNFEVDFYDKDDVLGVFMFELTYIEKQIIADFMYETYASEDYLVRWAALKQRFFVDDEIKILINSPANSLKEFRSSIELLKEENKKKVKMYLRRNRDDWKYKLFNWNLEGGE